jgi:hypothetical protein
MSFKTQADQDRAIQASHFQQESARGLEQIFSAYPTLIRCESNTRLITELCRDFMGEDVAPSLDTFRSFIDLNPGAMSTLAKRPVERTRELLVEDILTLLASKNGGRDGKFDSFNLRSEEKRMESWSLDALRNRLHEIRTKQRMASTPISELKKIVVDARPVPGYPTLPRQLFENGATVTVNAVYLKALDTYSLKRMCRTYSTEAVNQRLAEG